MIASSCWQSTTPFEEKVGNHPDPCKVPVLNLQTGAIKIIDFSDDDEEDVIESECKEVSKNNNGNLETKNIICEEVKNENRN